MITIGILNLQGAVSEHYDITKKAIENMGIEAEAISVRYADEVANCDGVIISGGESTVIGKIIKERGIKLLKITEFLFLELAQEWFCLVKKLILISLYWELWIFQLKEMHLEDR